MPRSPAGTARLPEPARLPRALTLAPRTRPPPHRPATHTPRSAPPPSPEAAARREAPARPPIAPSSAPQLSGQRPPGPGEGRCGGAGTSGQVGDHRRQKRGGPGKAAPSLRPSRAAARSWALGAAGAGRRARGGGGPGRSPTRGSCCLNAGALPSRRSPRPAQPRPLGAPVPCVPGRRSAPGTSGLERPRWPPSPTQSAAARLTAEALGRGEVRTLNGECVWRLLGVG